MRKLIDEREWAKAVGVDLSAVGWRQWRVAAGRKVGGALPKKRDKSEEEGGRLSGALNVDEGGEAVGFFGWVLHVRATR
jgi:hypothetical protein